MTESSSVSPASTFVIRFWREWSVSGSRWRGCIDHVQSGQRAEFVELQSILEFVRALGIMAEDEKMHREAEQ